MLKLFLFLASRIFLVFSQGGGDGNGGDRKGEEGGGGNDYTCDRCCAPSDPISILTLTIYLPVLVCSIILLPLIGFLMKKFEYSFFCLKRISKKYCFKNEFPEFSMYHGFYHQFGKWIYMPSISLNFNKNEVFGSGFDMIGKYEIKGEIKTNSKIQVINNNDESIDAEQKNDCWLCIWKKKYEFEDNSNFLIPRQNFDHAITLTLLASQIPNSNKPGFLGKYFVPFNKTEGVWYILPVEIKCDPETFLKPKYSKRLLLVYFALGFFNIVNLILWLKNYLAYDYSYNNYQNLVVGFQWHGILSFFGVVFILKNGKIFKNVLSQKVFTFSFYLVAYICCLLVIMISFGIIDMISGDFFLNNQSYERKNADWASISDIMEQCKLPKKDCAIIWFEEYSKQDSTCKNFYKSICFFFDPHENTCENTKERIAYFLLMSSTFNLIILILWISLIIFYYCVQRNLAFVLKNTIISLNDNKNLDDQDSHFLRGLIT